MVGVGDGDENLIELVEVITAESDESPLKSSEVLVGAISFDGGVDTGTAVADSLDEVAVVISFTGVDEMHLTVTVK